MEVKNMEKNASRRLKRDQIETLKMKYLDNQIKAV